MSDLKNTTMNNEDLPEPDFEHEAEEILDCPNCGREYDDIDVDYLICSKCGWSVEDKNFVIRP